VHDIFLIGELRKLASFGIDNVHLRPESVVEMVR
jgi:hypothetical protein